MKTAKLINEILVSIEKLIKNIRTLYSNIKESFKKEKNITISGLSLRAGGRGFPPATRSLSPGYFDINL